MKKKSIQPPQAAQKLLKRLLKEELAEEVLGDLEEDFIRGLEQSTASRVRRRYWYQTLHYLRPFALEINLFEHIHPFFMIRHNIRFAFRQFRREKFTFLINLIGLATGMAATLLIALWVWDEMAYDKFHEKKEDLYQVLQRVPVNDNEVLTWKWTPGLLAKTLKEEYPEVARATHVTTLGSKGILVKDDIRLIAKERYVGEDFFHLFSFPLLRGTPDGVFKEKRSLVLTRDLALKIFGSLDNVVGQTLEWERQWQEAGGSFVVTGIVENPPKHSSLKFELLFSYDFYVENKPDMLEWYNSDPETFIALKEGSSWQAFEQKIEDLIQRKQDGANETLFLQKYADRYLHDQFQNGKQAGGRILYVQLFAALAVFILLIACINFMNLSTAKATKRFKEIGVKKTLGANKHALAGQYMSEALLVTLLAFLVAILLTELLLPHFSVLTGKELNLTWSPGLVMISLGIVCFTGFASGSYPAFYLSRFHPAFVLKGKSSGSLKEAWVRKGLVIFQFVLSILLLVAVGIVYQQIHFIQSKNLGFDKENVIVLQKVGNLEEDMNTFLTEVKKIPGVLNASTMDTDMIGNYGHTTALFWEGNNQKENPIRFGVIIGGKELIETLNMEMLEGKSFADEGANQGGYIFNEAAIKAMGLSDPLGKQVQRRREEHPIIGVVKDFHFESLYQGVRPCYIRRGTYGDNVLIKLAGGNHGNTLALLEAYYRKFNPGLPFQFFLSR